MTVNFPSGKPSPDRPVLKSSVFRGSEFYKKFEISSEGSKGLRCFDSVIWSVVIFVQTFVERLSVCVYTIAEIFACCGTAAVFKLSETLRQSVAGLDAVKTRNDRHKKDNGGKNSGKEKCREFIVKKLSEKNAETRTK